MPPRPARGGGPCPPARPAEAVHAAPPGRECREPVARGPGLGSLRGGMPAGLRGPAGSCSRRAWLPWLGSRSK